MRYGFDISLSLSKWMCAADCCRRGTNEKWGEVGYAELSWVSSREAGKLLKLISPDSISTCWLLKQPHWYWSYDKLSLSCRLYQRKAVFGLKVSWSWLIDYGKVQQSLSYPFRTLWIKGKIWVIFADFDFVIVQCSDQVWSQVLYPHEIFTAGQ